MAGWDGEIDHIYDTEDCKLRNQCDDEKLYEFNPRAGGYVEWDTDTAQSGSNDGRAYCEQYYYNHLDAVAQFFAEWTLVSYEDDICTDQCYKD